MIPNFKFLTLFFACLSLLTACSDTAMKTPGQISTEKDTNPPVAISISTNSGYSFSLSQDQLVDIGRPLIVSDVLGDNQEFSLKLSVRYDNGLVSSDDITQAVINEIKQQLKLGQEQTYMTSRFGYLSADTAELSSSIDITTDCLSLQDCSKFSYTPNLAANFQPFSHQSPEIYRIQQKINDLDKVLKRLEVLLNPQTKVSQTTNPFAQWVTGLFEKSELIALDKQFQDLQFQDLELDLILDPNDPYPMAEASIASISGQELL